MRPMLEHILAAVQYVLGDLKAADSPGVPSKKYCCSGSLCVK